MRIFKTKWFAREARSHGISDDELYQAIQSALQGKVVDLGGGVYKKRLNKNRDRAIILTKKAQSIGFIPFYMPNRIWPISTIAN